MARPRKTETQLESATERVPAPETVNVPEYAQQYQPPPPRQMRIERQGGRSEPYVRHHPQVRGGVCEFCGVLDGNTPAQYQYKLCPHYRGQQLWCSYCPDSKDPDDVNYHSVLHIVDHPVKPNTLVVVCDSTTCTEKFQKEFNHSL